MTEETVPKIHAVNDDTINQLINQKQVFERKCEIKTQLVLK